MTDWEECNGKGFGKLKTGTVPSQNLPVYQDDLTLGAHIDLDHTFPDKYEEIVKNLEKTGGPVVNDHDYSTRNSNLIEL